MGRVRARKSFFQKTLEAPRGLFGRGNEEGERRAAKRHAESQLRGHRADSVHFSRTTSNYRVRRKPARSSECAAGTWPPRPGKRWGPDGSDTGVLCDAHSVPILRRPRFRAVASEAVGARRERYGVLCDMHSVPMLRRPRFRAVASEAAGTRRKRYRVWCDAHRVLILRRQRFRRANGRDKRQVSSADHSVTPRIPGYGSGSGEELATMRSIRIVVVGVVLAAVVAVAVVGTGPVLAQWPTTCVELNDIVEAHLGNDGNVGIYQRVFGSQAEAACQNDHRDDVRGVFAWAFADGSPSADFRRARPGVADGLRGAERHRGGAPGEREQRGDLSARVRRAGGSSLPQRPPGGRAGRLRLGLRRLHADTSDARQDPLRQHGSVARLRAVD